MDRCARCISATSCIQCLNPFIIRKGSQCGCPDGQFVEGGICANCPEHCETCSGMNSCTSCEESYEIDDGLCQYKGIPVWLVVVLVIVGILVIGVISGNFFLIKYW